MGLAGIVFDLFTKPPHRHIDRAHIPVIVIIPHPLHEIFPGEDLSAFADKIGEKVVFLLCQIDRRTVFRHLIGFGV